MYLCVDFFFKFIYSRFIGVLAKIIKSDYQLRYVCPSVRPRGTTRFPLDGVSRKLIFEYFLVKKKICCIQFHFHENLIKISDTLHEYVCTYMIVSRSILLRMRNAIYIIVEKIKTHILP